MEGNFNTLVATAAPTLTSRVGIGMVHAAQILVTAGQNIDPLHSDPAFARLCGAAPFPSRPARPTDCGSTTAATGKLTGPCT